MHREKGSPALLTVSDILSNPAVSDKWEAIQLVGQRLVAAGRVDPEYVQAMVQRETEFTTYIGNGLAIPHGVSSAKRHIRASGLAVAQFPAGLDFEGGNRAYLVIGLAGLGEEHLEILSNIALRCEEPAWVRQMASEPDPQVVLKALL